MRIAILLPFVVACVTEHGQTPAEQRQQLWESLALPALEAGNCLACHASQDEIGFLAGADEEAIRQTLLESGRVDLEQRFTSAIFTKGLHEGDTLTANQINDIATWLAAEQNATETGR